MPTTIGHRVSPAPRRILLPRLSSVGEQYVIRTNHRTVESGGVPAAAIAEYLNAKGIHTKRGKMWHQAAVARIL
ncbi:recombinase family protein [Patescibacteria group bacterium]|nr:recombinase family protein [Patescibacteria group bacterium]